MSSDSPQWGLKRGTSSPPVPLLSSSSVASLLSAASAASLTSSTVVPLRRHSVFGFEDRLVLDFSVKSVIVGLSGEPRPRYVLPIHVPSLNDPAVNAGLWEPTVDAKLTPRRREVLIDLFLSIYNKFILTDSKQRKVIICDKILLPMPIKTLIVDVLFRNFQVPTIHFASADLLALMALGRSSGIVVDIGHLETTVVPVFDGRPINQLVKFAPLGSQSLIDRLKLLIKNHASLTVSVPPQAPPPPPTSPSLSSQPVLTLLDQTMADQPPYFWSNLIAQTVFIPPSASRMDMSVLASRNTMGNYAIFDSTASSTTVRVPASKNHAESVLKLPGWVRERAGEVWFEGAGTVYGDDDSIVSLILDVLVKLPLDLRTELAGNIVVTGEGSVVPGVMTRIETELRLVGGDTGFMVRSTTGGSRRGFLHRFDEVRRLVRDRVCVLRSCYQPNLVAWVGASVVGALKMGVSEVVKDDYLKAKEEGGGEAVVPDWSRLKMDEITKLKDEE